MKRIIPYLLVLGGLMACSRDGDDLPSGDAVPVTFRGMLSPSMQLTRLMPRMNR